MFIIRYVKENCKSKLWKSFKVLLLKKRYLGACNNTYIIFFQNVYTIEKSPPPAPLHTQIQIKLRKKKMEKNRAKENLLLQVNYYL